MAEESPSTPSVQDAAGELVRLLRPPDEILAEAAKAAKALKDVIDKKLRKVMFNNEQYLEFEDWQTVGRFYGITAKIISVDFVQYGSVKGFTARAVALRGDGMEISGAEAECLDDEEKWRARAKYEWRETPQGREKHQIGEEPVPFFQLKSMAQTRACAKVLRNVLAWVVVLAGYRPTPSEELDAEVVKSDLVQSEPTATMGQPATLPAESILRVRDVIRKTGEKNGKPWTSYIVTLSNGRSGSTFNMTLGTKAQFFLTNRTPVDPTATIFEQKGKFCNLLTLEAAAKIVVGASAVQLPPVPPAPVSHTDVLTITGVGAKKLPGGTIQFYELQTQELGSACIRTIDQASAKMAFDAKLNGDQLEVTYQVTDEADVYSLVRVGAIVRAKPEPEIVEEFLPS